MRKSEPMGLIDLGWSTKLVLPLSKAHQLQSLLLEAKQYDNEYLGKHVVRVITAFSTPSVAVKEAMNEMDLSDKPKALVSEYLGALRSAFKDNPEASLDDVVPYDNWYSLRGD